MESPPPARDYLRCPRPQQNHFPYADGDKKQDWRDWSQNRVDCDWTEHFSSSGKKYYYNTVSEVSQWEKPQQMPNSYSPADKRPSSRPNENHERSERSSRSERSGRSDRSSRSDRVNRSSDRQETSHRYDKSKRTDRSSRRNERSSRSRQSDRSGRSDRSNRRSDRSMERFDRSQERNEKSERSTERVEKSDKCEKSERSMDRSTERADRLEASDKPDKSSDRSSRKLDRTDKSTRSSWSEKVDKGQKIDKTAEDGVGLNRTSVNNYTADNAERKPRTATATITEAAVPCPDVERPAEFVSSLTPSIQGNANVAYNRLPDNPLAGRLETVAVHPQLSTSLAWNYREDLTRHTTGWPSQVLQTLAEKFTEEASILQNNLSHVSVQLKDARSIVRQKEISTTLQDQRMMYLRQRISRLEREQSSNSFMSDDPLP